MEGRGGVVGVGGWGAGIVAGIVLERSSSETVTNLHWSRRLGRGGKGGREQS